MGVQLENFLNKIEVGTEFQVRDYRQYPRSILPPFYVPVEKYLEDGKYKLNLETPIAGYRLKKIFMENGVLKIDIESRLRGGWSKDKSIFANLPTVRKSVIVEPYCRRSTDGYSLIFLHGKNLKVGRYTAYFNKEERCITLVADPLGSNPLICNDGKRGYLAINSLKLSLFIQENLKIFIGDKMGVRVKDNMIHIFPWGETPDLTLPIGEKINGLTTNVSDMAKFYDPKIFFPKGFNIMPGVYRSDFSVTYGVKLTPDITGDVRIRRVYGRPKDGVKSLAGCIINSAKFGQKVKNWFDIQKNQLFFVEVKDGIVYFNK